MRTRRDLFRAVLGAAGLAAVAPNLAAPPARLGVVKGWTFTRLSVGDEVLGLQPDEPIRVSINEDGIYAARGLMEKMVNRDPEVYQEGWGDED